MARVQMDHHRYLSFCADVWVEDGSEADLEIGKVGKIPPPSTRNSPNRIKQTGKSKKNIRQGQGANLLSWIKITD